MFSARFLPNFLLIGFLYSGMTGVSALMSGMLELPFRRQNPLTGSAARIGAWVLVVFSIWCLIGLVTLLTTTGQDGESWFFVRVLRAIGFVE